MLLIIVIILLLVCAIDGEIDFWKNAEYHHYDDYDFWTKDCFPKRR